MTRSAQQPGDLIFLCLLLVGGLIVASALPGSASAQERHLSHRSLEPDYQNMAQWQARIELLRRLGLIDESTTDDEAKRHPLLRPEFQRALNDLKMQESDASDSSVIKRLKDYLQRQQNGPRRNGTGAETRVRPGQSPTDVFRPGERSSTNTDDRWNSNRPTARPGQNSRPRSTGTFPSSDPSESMADFLRNTQERATRESNEAIDPSLSLTDRLTRITDQARISSLNGESDSGDSSKASSSGNGGPSRFASILEKATRDAMKAMEGRSDFQQELQRRANRARNRPRGGREGPSGLERLNRSADNWFSGFSGAGSSSGFNGPSAPGGGGSMGFISGLLTMAALGAGVWWLIQQRSLREAAQAERDRLPTIPSTLRTRGDIVLAFHAIVARCPAVLADWWPHRRAAEALAESKPQTQGSVDTLAELYELARYLPEDSELTTEQLEHARRAVQGCRES